MRLTARNLVPLVALLAAGAAFAADLTPSQVFQGADQYNGMDISVTGIVSFLKSATEADGTPYQSFKLCDAYACLTVYTTDTNTYIEGKQLTAQGHFWRVKRVGYHVYYNEFDLDSAAPAATGN